jgi:hypothetical protein
MEATRHKNQHGGFFLQLLSSKTTVSTVEEKRARKALHGGPKSLIPSEV